MGGNKAARRRLQRLARPLAIHPSRRRLCLAYDLRQQKKGRNHLDYGCRDSGRRNRCPMDLLARPRVR
jgi:hypothetical protein